MCWTTLRTSRFPFILNTSHSLHSYVIQGKCECLLHLLLYPLSCYGVQHLTIWSIILALHIYNQLYNTEFQESIALLFLCMQFPLRIDSYSVYICIVNIGTYWDFVLEMVLSLLIIRSAFDVDDRDQWLMCRYWFNEIVIIVIDKASPCRVLLVQSHWRQEC